MSFPSRTRAFRFWCTVFGFAAFATLTMATLTFGQGGVDDPNGPFQLEGNATVDTSICWEQVSSNGGPAIATPSGTNCPSGFTLINFISGSHDWSDIFNGNAGTPATAFVTDSFNLSNSSDDSFLGTATKDTMDISQWAWNFHNVQDKDDIEHAFAAAYTLANGDTAIYAGMDRFANNGDSTAGFWFVQDSTFDLCTGPGQGSSGPNPACTANGTFAGHHQIGDMLIVSDFSIGGAVSTINIFLWNGTSIPSTPNASLSPAPCDLLTGSAKLCGVVDNSVSGLVPTGGWGFLDKKGNSAYLPGEFLEIGVDLNFIFPNGIPCFSRFFAETRSSTSVSASLSDLTKPVSFPFCAATITKACGTAALQQNTGAPDTILYTFSGTIKNTGLGNLFSPTLTDTPPSGVVVPNTLSESLGALPDTCNGSPCLKHNDTVNYTGSFQTNAVLGSGVVNHADATLFTSATDGSPVKATDANDATHTKIGADWPLNPNGTQTCTPVLQATLALTKCCQTTLVSQGAELVVQIAVSGHVCSTNSGAGTVDITGVTVTDDHAGTLSLSSTTLEPGACATFSKTYNPSSATSIAPGPLGTTVATFTDTVSVTSATGQFNTVVTLPPPVAASCTLSTSAACLAP
jgi:hypothetical protein